MNRAWAITLATVAGWSLLLFVAAPVLNQPWLLLCGVVFVVIAVAFPIINRRRQ
jgi:uncharacterized membrane protein